MKNDEPAKQENSLKHIEWWFLFAILVIILVTVFALTNAAPAPVRFFFWTVEISLALLIFLSAAVGAVIAISLMLMKQRRYRKDYRQIEKRLSDARRENARLETQVVELEGRIRSASKSNATGKNDDYDPASIKPNQSG